MNNLLINLSVVFDQPTGISNYITNLFPYLQKLQPTLLTSQNYDGFECYSIPGNMTPKQGSKGHLRRLLWTQFKLPKIYRQLNSQLLFSPQPEAPIFSKNRYIIHVHDIIPLRFPNPRSPLTNYFRYYLPQVLNQAEHIICNSQATAADVQKYYNIPAHKITSILLAHNPQHFFPCPDKTSCTPNYFLYLGRQDPYKNLSNLINAFAELINNSSIVTNSELKQYQLWFAGPYDKRFTPTLQAQIQELGITNQVKFLNYVQYDELPKIISNAIALVFPSLWEGFGFPVLEAMACATPVITSNLSSLPEVTGEAAILIDPYNQSEISNAMGQIATDTNLRQKLCQQSLQRSQQFSWEKTAQQTIEVLSRYL